MKRVAVILSLSVLPALKTEAQTAPYRNVTFDPNIMTVLLHKQNEPENPLPVLYLNSGDQLRLAFDKLGTDGDFFQYTLVHCNAAWNPSNLQPLQYLSGSLQGQISTFSSSRNALQRYTHYESLVPASDMRILFSGNYLLKVFRNFDESQLVFTRRLMVLDQKFVISSTARSATLPSYRFSRQEIDFTVTYRGYTIVNPNNDVKAVILQNYFWGNAITLTKPLMYNNTELTYNYEQENTFEAANEFRVFDTRSLRFYSQNVDHKVRDTVTLAYLKPEEPRNKKPYLQYTDFNGKAVITNRDGTDPGTDGDYAWYFFTLKTPAPLAGDVYITGQLSNWQLDSAFRCTWSAEAGAYQASVKLKQGYYNYLYAVVDPATGAVSWEPTEGSYSETENDYTILVYCRNIQYGYDELLGMDFKNSRRN